MKKEEAHVGQRVVKYGCYDHDVHKTKKGVIASIVYPNHFLQETVDIRWNDGTKTAELVSTVANDPSDCN